MAISEKFIIGLCLGLSFARGALGQVPPADAHWTSASTRELFGEAGLRRVTEVDEHKPGLGQNIGQQDVLRTGGEGSMAAILFDDNRTLAELGEASLFTFSATNAS